MAGGERSWIAGNWQKILAGLFWAVALAAYFLYSYQNSLSPLETLRRVADFTRSSDYGPVLFIGLYTVRPLFLFSAALLTVGAGALFGPIWGGVYAVIGSNAGATLAYFLGRFFGQGLIDESDEESRLAVYTKPMREESFITVFLMRLAFLPYDLVNYLAGFLRINFWAFLLATALGSIPGTISFVLFGASSGLDSGRPEFDWRILAASVLIFVVSVALSKSIKKNNLNKKKAR